MYRFAVLLALALPLSSLAADPLQSVRRWSESQPLTRTAPTASCTAAVSPEGTQLDGVRAIRLMLEAPSGQTLSGGSLLAWYYDHGAGAWFRNPANDLTVTSGLAKQAWEDLPVYIRTGCVIYATSSVTLSGAGTAVTVRIVGWTGVAW